MMRRSLWWPTPDQRAGTAARRAFTASQERPGRRGGADDELGDRDGAHVEHRVPIEFDGGLGPALEVVDEHVGVDQPLHRQRRAPLSGARTSPHDTSAAPEGTALVAFSACDQPFFSALRAARTAARSASCRATSVFRRAALPRSERR